MIIRKLLTLVIFLFFTLGNQVFTEAGEKKGLTEEEKLELQHLKKIKKELEREKEMNNSGEVVPPCTCSKPYSPIAQRVIPLDNQESAKMLIGGALIHCKCGNLECTLMWNQSSSSLSCAKSKIFDK